MWVFYCMRGFPPLNALVAFDAAMRARSFARAAGALSLTPGAIGQQIRKLEEWLNMPLFVRRVREVQPTTEGLAY